MRTLRRPHGSAQRHQAHPAQTPPRSLQIDTPGAFLLAFVGIGYMALIVILPFANVFVQAFSKGIGPFLAVLAEPEFRQAVKMTLLLSAVAVPINTVFGVLAALFLSRNRFRGKELLISFMDLPFAISPVVTGMMFVLLYGRSGLFAPLISRFGFNIVFAFPGMEGPGSEGGMETRVDEMAVRECSMVILYDQGMWQCK